MMMAVLVSEKADNALHISTLIGQEGQQTLLRYGNPCFMLLVPHIRHYILYTASTNGKTTSLTHDK